MSEESKRYADWIRNNKIGRGRTTGVELGEEPDWHSNVVPLAPQAKRNFDLVNVADVEPHAVDWIWPGYLAKGKLTLLGGDPDLGKSLVCIDAAATLSKGKHWPSGPRANTGATIFICSEDGIADTIRPRAEAAEADLQLIKVFNSTVIRDGKRKSFNLRDDLDILGEAIRSTENVSLIVIDAITSYMGAIDSHRTTDVRAVLEPISGFAEQHGVSVLGVTHPPKAASGNALRAFTGSFAFVAAPRVAFFVTSEPETDRRLLLPVKNNIGPKAMGRGYFIATKYVTNTYYEEPDHPFRALPGGCFMTAPPAQWHFSASLI
jgi:putative DNA primase/helicase